MKRKHFSKSTIVSCLILLSAVYILFNIQLYTKEKKVIYWDVLEYYSYLPALFIHHDLSFKFIEADPVFYNDNFWPLDTPHGGKVIKMSMGMSFLYAPFFFAAHGAAHLTGYKADGFSSPYKLALQLSSLFYLAIGLFFLRKVLLRYFSDGVTALTILAVTVGTNLYYYASFDAPMSHVYNFTLFAVFIWLTIRWYEKPALKISLLLGFLGGLILLIRPSNGVIVLFFILYGVTGFSSFTKRLGMLMKQWQKIGIILGCAFLVWVPQLIYWKYNAGQWLYYSYSKEGFFFSDPQFLNGLFSYRKGWFVYTPIMFLVAAGFYVMYKQGRKVFAAVLVFIVLHFYIVVSWWSWWYGGGFGLRPMVETYALMAFPMAYFIKWLVNAKMKICIPGLTLLFLLTAYSAFQTAQYYYGSIHWDAMSKAAYWNSFLRLRPTAEFYHLIESPDYEKTIKGERD